MRGSVLLGILGVFAGYTVTSYGYVLMRGYNITFRQWISPLNPYVWSGIPAKVPAGQIFPGQTQPASSG